LRKGLKSKSLQNIDNFADFFPAVTSLGTEETKPHTAKPDVHQ